MKLLIGGWIVFVIVLVAGLLKATNKASESEFIEYQNNLMRLALERSNKHD